MSNWFKIALVVVIVVITIRIRNDIKDLREQNEVLNKRFLLLDEKLNKLVDNDRQPVFNEDFDTRLRILEKHLQKEH
jgi:hypothetical protein